MWATAAFGDTAKVLRCEFDNRPASAEFRFTVTALHGSTGCVAARRVARGVLTRWTPTHGFPHKARVMIRERQLAFRCAYRATPSPTQLQDSDNGSPAHHENLKGAVTRGVCQRAARVVRFTMTGTGRTAPFGPSPIQTNDDSG